ncbi:hypothetical protein GQ42DRAFT_92493 [Ramicandelaber brevisporus]|nr:hypothetical protein GQ42DRAFT_92493 [Ramicandelaber brevisporus]
MQAPDIWRLSDLARVMLVSSRAPHQHRITSLQRKKNNNRDDILGKWTRERVVANMRDAWWAGIGFLILGAAAGICTLLRHFTDRAISGACNGIMTVPTQTVVAMTNLCHPSIAQRQAERQRQRLSPPFKPATFWCSALPDATQLPAPIITALVITHTHTHLLFCATLISLHYKWQAQQYSTRWLPMRRAA